MERFCKNLKEHATKIINYEKKKEMIPLTDEENKSYEKHKVSYSRKNLVLIIITKLRSIKSIKK